MQIGWLEYSLKMFNIGSIMLGYALPNIIFQYAQWIQLVNNEIYHKIKI